MAGCKNAGFNLPDIGLVGSTNAMNQPIINGTFGKVNVIADQYFSGIFIFTSI